MGMSSVFHRATKALAVGGLLVFAGQAAFATIVGSKHDLTVAGSGAYKVGAGDTAEVCVFCHTPHGANTAALGPLWNKPVSGGAFTSYSSATLDSTPLTPTGSTSTLCLSCHDGATSMDVLVNVPGSGGWVAGGAAAGYTWAPAAIIAAGITAIGVDLTNDHPIGVAYCGGFAAGACRDPDFQLATLRKNVAGVVTSGAAAAVVGAALTDQWWVNTGAVNNTREKTDMVLYARTFANPAGIFPSVECASCHEPHEPTGTFLRISNAASALCVACHVK